MTNQSKQELAHMMLTKIQLVDQFKDQYPYTENLRHCPFQSELVGIELALKTLGISYAFAYDKNDKIVKVTVAGVSAEINQ